jgi:hypothetical protein
LALVELLAVAIMATATMETILHSYQLPQLLVVAVAVCILEEAKPMVAMVALAVAVEIPIKELELQVVREQLIKVLLAVLEIQSK